jgi:hypothetical protein
MTTLRRAQPCILQLLVAPERGQRREILTRARAEALA